MRKDFFFIIKKSIDQNNKNAIADYVLLCEMWVELKFLDANCSWMIDNLSLYTGFDQYKRN